MYRKLATALLTLGLVVGSAGGASAHALHGKSLHKVAHVSPAGSNWTGRSLDGEQWSTLVG
jgi:hypothetical protein